MDFVPSPEGRGEWTHLQSSGEHCRDGSCSEDGDVCSIEKPRAGGPEHPDHILCRKRFPVPAGVEVISFPIWNPMAFQSIVLRFSVYVPPFPSDRRTILPAREGWQTQLPCSLFFIFYGLGISVFELDYPFSISQVEPGLGYKNLPFEMELFTLLALQQVLFNTAVPFSRQQCVVKIFLRLPRT